jgi:serine phosphatase RsbU (regulator of sigma subunit)
MRCSRAGVAVTAPDPALLVVDDNEDNRYTLVQRLKRQGYTNVTTAVNGREALELLHSRPFDLVLLDVTMPEMNGYEVLEKLKADARLRHLPVVMISAVDQVESAVRCIELGAEDYLPKPFNPTLLRARVGACLEKKRLRDEIDAHLARIEAELESARRIQLSMVPSTFPVATAEAPVGIFASLYPAREIGGDLYDFFYIDPGTLCVVVADVSDKGAAAALFMARTKTLIRTLANLMRGANGAIPEPHEVVARMNEELCQDNPHCMFATVLLATLDLGSRQLSFCNAGHPPPYVVGPAGLTTLQAPRGKPLGIRRSFTYGTTTRQLEVGDCLFLFTDGVTEALDANGQLFSEPRLEEVLRSVAEGSTQSVVTAVVDAVRRFAGDAAQSDDIAALAVRLVG